MYHSKVKYEDRCLPEVWSWPWQGCGNLRLVSNYITYCCTCDYCVLLVEGVKKFSKCFRKYVSHLFKVFLQLLVRKFPFLLCKEQLLLCKLHFLWVFCNFYYVSFLFYCISEKIYYVSYLFYGYFATFTM